MNALPEWQPAAKLTTLKRRAEMLNTARAFFAARQVLEVETPLLCGHSVTDPHIRSIAVDFTGSRHWLRTSPEYHMKRLLAAGAGDIYQIGKAFRADESGRWHQPEFSMIEWYRCGIGLEQMIAECVELIAALSQHCRHPVSDHQRISYKDAYINSCGIDPLTAGTEELRAYTAMLPGISDNPAHTAALTTDRQTCLDLLASHVVHPSFRDRGLWVIDQYPADQAMLACLNPDNPLVADRFEIFLNGVELANGFRELSDATEQATRFAVDRERRRASSLDDMQADPKLLAALESGLPECAGVAVGLDRLLMIADGHTDISETMSFIPGG